MNRTDWAPEFSARFARHADELKWLYCGFGGKRF